jgi:restriction system protein
VKFPDPEAFQREARKLYRAWKDQQPAPAGSGDVETDDAIGSSEAASTFEEAEELAWIEIRAYLAEMPPYDFQDLVAALLRGMSYHVLWVAPPGPDRGIDMVAHTDPLGATFRRARRLRPPTPSVEADLLPRAPRVGYVYPADRQAAAGARSGSARRL